MRSRVVLLALALAPVAAVGAELDRPISGAPAALPSRFVPMRYTITQPNPPPTVAPEPTRPVVERPFVFALPLVDRRLSLTEKAAPLAGALIDAMARIEPLYDPTLIDGPADDHAMSVSAGTAMMDDVFADHWHAASADPNVNRKVPYLAMAWERMPGLACDAFFKNRAHGYGDPALTALTPSDCAALSPRQAAGLDRPLEIASGRNSVPVFAAPLPGSRLSSADFWAAQRARIAAIQAHLHRKWQPARREAQGAMPTTR